MNYFKFVIWNYIISNTCFMIGFSFPKTCIGLIPIGIISFGLIFLPFDFVEKIKLS